MKHFGDITKLTGYDLPVVDVITGGSPCQDLSVAGKRAGLAGERSGLFMEQMRIVKEMRERDRADGRSGWAVRPRYMVWENVPGAFSSGTPKGSDFQAVLEEIVRVVCKEAPPVPIPKDGWPKAGCLSGVGDSGCTFSVAWRVHDAQFWGVPQRRKRIALVADFGGLSAPEILFERKGLSGDPAESGEAGQGAAAGTESGAGAAISFHLLQDPITSEDKAPCLSSGNSDNGQAMVGVLAFKQGNGSKAGGIGAQEECSPTLSAVASGTNQVPAILSGKAMNPWDSQSARVYHPDGVWHSLNANENGGQSRDAVLAFAQNQRDEVRNLGNVAGSLAAEPGMKQQTFVAACIGNGQADQTKLSDKVGALNCMHDQQAVLVPEVARALKAKGNCDFREDSETYPVQGSVVRRLTPLECERLQGYPDGWTDIGEWVDSKGKKHKDADSPRYKALGNSIALPFWEYLARRICAQYERPVTMGSLFDGIGGFPLVFERCGAKAVWASEIEEFPIAVTKKHFPECEL